MKDRGLPDNLSYICLPEEEDLQKYKKMVEDKQKLTHIHEEPI